MQLEKLVNVTIEQTQNLFVSFLFNIKISNMNFFMINLKLLINNLRHKSHHTIYQFITNNFSFIYPEYILIILTKIPKLLSIKFMLFYFTTIQYSFSKTSKLVIVRHGQSLWNKQKRWTGWSDVRLSSTGISQAKQCGKLLKEHGFAFDEAYSSVLTRSVQTLNNMLDELDAHGIPVHKTWRLNEKHYGTLTGQNKMEITEKYGQEKVAQWRRSFTIPPPPVDINHERHPSKDIRYAEIPLKQLPCAQSQNDVIRRLNPLWNEEILPKLLTGKHILISAHGGSARGLAKIITDLPEQQIMELNLPHTTPLVFSFSNSQDSLKFENMKYIGNIEQINVKMSIIKNENKPPAV